MITEPIKLKKWNVDDQKRVTIDAVNENNKATEDAINEIATSAAPLSAFSEIHLNVKDAEFGAKGNFKVSPTTDKPATGFPDNDALDDAPAIQRALDRCRAEGGGIVYFPIGNYPIKSVLRVYRNTKVVFHPKARIVRNARISVFFTNGDGIAQPTKYNGEGNISFSGGIMDGNIANFDWRFNFFSIGHADGVLFENMQLIDIQTYHAIEVNGCRRVRITNCLFEGYTLDTAYGATNPDRQSEAVQIDGMIDSSVFGQFGAYDKTFCEDVEVSGCTFRDWDRGVGSHSGFTGYGHKDIRIANNHFENIFDIAVVTCMWDGTVIEGNTFRKVGGGVWIRLKDSTDDTSNYIIANNTFRDISVGNSARHAVRINGLEGTTKKIHGVVITGNNVDGCAQTAFYIQGVSRLTVSNNVLVNVAAGIYLLSCDEGTVNGNSLSLVTVNTGINLDTSTWINITGNMLNKIGMHGIALINGCTNNVVSANSVREVSMASALQYSNIYIAGSSHSCVIIGNTVKSGKPDCGLWITSTCQNVLSSSNHVNPLKYSNNGTPTKENVNYV